MARFLNLIKALYINMFVFFPVSFDALARVMLLLWQQVNRVRNEVKGRNESVSRELVVKNSGRVFPVKIEG